MEPQKNKETFWRRYCIWYTDKKWIPMFLTAYILSMFSSILLNIAIPGVDYFYEFMVSLVAILVGLNRIEKAITEELSDLHTELQDSGEFDKLKHTLLKEAKKKAEREVGRNPDRRLTAVCHNCDNDIYSDDELYTNRNGNCFCTVCWNIEGSRE